MNGTVQNNVKNILIAGVGGQGTLLASKLMGKCFIGEGYDVKVSEVHGMSQRGGSVVTYVRYGDKAVSYTHLDVYKRQGIHARRVAVFRQHNQVQRIVAPVQFPQNPIDKARSFRSLFREKRLQNTDVHPGYLLFHGCLQADVRFSISNPRAKNK